MLIPVVLIAAAGCSKNSSARAQATASPSSTATASSTASASVAPRIISSLDAITVSGAPGAAPTVSAEWPLAVKETMSKVITPGTGAVVTSSSTVEVNYLGIDARTGATFDSSFSRGKTTSFGLSQVIAGFSKGLDGKHVGDRVLLAVSGPDGYDSAGGAASAGINVGDTLVFVVDIVSVQLTQPAGSPVTPPAGLPTVSGDINNPAISFPPDAKEPTDLVVQPLIAGTGKKVSAGDTVTVNYLGVEWGSGRVIGTTYADGKPAPQTGALTGTIEGWQKGLVNQTVGSRVLLVVPGSLAYPAGNATPSIAPGKTLVFVVDILFTQPAS
ncbi:peptidylprolyl isomerase [Propionibacterium cyclohexanicum]|uniref:peptidylprolyl isomerase n=1 Tax=Propionibacterium cyclohexanicum TaxID=64702 RepID=A0A1H9QTL1_9ACTN|nr:FKBP-type peptidyl-prolyl cis-trans isomerase [Propionibacterium cyclohexanicum]SER63788.1 peptidylprolyl isomerase [Propionibacterium cyclohexanicum]